MNSFVFLVAIKPIDISLKQILMVEIILINPGFLLPSSF